jgi:Mor family transcriptional regulator
VRTLKKENVGGNGAVDMSKLLVYISRKGVKRQVIYDLKTIKIENEFLNGIYNDLANLIGMDATKTIFDEYRGQQITFPVEFYSKKFIHNQIVKEYNGFNVKQLATKYEYSERTIRRILKEHIDNEEN